MPEKKQDNRMEIFNVLKPMLSKYESEMKILSDFESRYELSGVGEYEVTSEKTGKTTTKEDPYFGAIIIQSKYLGLYLMAPYMFPDEFKGEFPLMDKALKGKSCFHIKKLDKELLIEAEQAIDWCYQKYKDKNWI